MKCLVVLKRCMRCIGISCQGQITIIILDDASSEREFRVEYILDEDQKRYSIW